MPLETFTGPAVGPLLAQVHDKLGAEALVIKTSRVPRGIDAPLFEVLACDQASVAGWNSHCLTRASAPELTRFNPLECENGRARKYPRRPLSIALVGPTGAGKTTTIAKLIGHERAFGKRRVGLLSFDTYRVGAVEQLQTYAELARVPLEVVYAPGEVRPALRRLGDVEVVLIDTPGRGPRNRQDSEQVDRCLRVAEPDEVHVTVPVGLRRELALGTITSYRERGATHLIATKLDEWECDWTLFELAAECRMPMRWATDGQEVPTDIRSASPRLLAALASTSTNSRQARGGAA